MGNKQSNNADMYFEDEKYDDFPLHKTQIFIQKKINIPLGELCIYLFLVCMCKCIYVFVYTYR